MQPGTIVSHDEWLKARKAHLKNEKALTRMQDLVAAERRALPWVKVDKTYVFDTPDGEKSLSELFGSNDQLVVYHFMWLWKEGVGCKSCSLNADHAEGPYIHLVNHGVSYVRVTRGPAGEFDAYNRRMGWTTPWASSHRSDFSFDYGVSFTEAQLEGKVNYNYATIDGKDAFTELPGFSVFAKNDAGEVFHTYSSYARGTEGAIDIFFYLDMTPKGRNENEIMDWVKRHDEYGIQPAGQAAACCSQGSAA
jgi:predicted dithiol-disulfide oxidoreductase (DUF899 family)